MLRYLTAGESHGPALVGILEGLPAGLPLTAEDLDRDLARRQLGYGRGARMKIERDRVEILAGVRFGETLGSPLALLIRNRDYENWQERMSPVGPRRGPAFTRPRPGHADLAGVLKYGREDVRDILERASARETAMRVALGGAAKALLGQFGIRILSHVVALGSVEAHPPDLPFDEMWARVEASPVRTADPDAEARMIAAIEEARAEGDTLGGVVEIRVEGVPVGLGSHVHADRRLDGRLSQALASIPAIKGVAVGDAFSLARQRGSQVHDEIFYAPGRGFYRETNRAGGLEGGMTTGEPLVLRMAMKPLSSLMKPLRSVDLVTREAQAAGVERSDVTAVPAAGVVGEAVVALVLADAFLEKFGGDSLAEVRRNVDAYRQGLPR